MRNIKAAEQNDNGSEPVVARQASEVKVKLGVWFPELAEEMIESLVRFREELISFSKSLTLVSLSTIRNAETFHISDCVLAANLIRSKIPSGSLVHEMGSGNGCAGLILALLNPNLNVVICETKKEHLDFSRHAALVMRLQNVSFENVSPLDLPVGSARFVVTRDVGTLSKTLLNMRKLVPKGGLMFHLKSDGWAVELASIPTQLCSHWSPSLLGQYRLPENGVNMVVVLTEKTTD